MISSGTSYATQDSQHPISDRTNNLRLADLHSCPPSTRSACELLIFSSWKWFICVYVFVPLWKPIRHSVIMFENLSDTGHLQKLFHKSRRSTNWRVSTVTSTRRQAEVCLYAGRIFNKCTIKIGWTIFYTLVNLKLVCGTTFLYSSRMRFDAASLTSPLVCSSAGLTTC